MRLGELSAYARIGAGPPTYAPDSFPPRTVDDELEQALEGVDAGEVTETELAEVEEIVRRAFETVRLMNTVVMNGNTVDGQQNVASTMVRQDTSDTGRYYEPIMAPSIVDSVALENLHQSLLVALRSGTAPWFADVLRDHDEIGDLTDNGRRKMPAMMRGADGRYLTLTRRQMSLIRAVAPARGLPAEATHDDRPGQPHGAAALPRRRQPAEHAAALGDLELLPGPRVRLPQRLAAAVRRARAARGRRLRARRRSRAARLAGHRLLLVDEVRPWSR